MAEYKGKIFYCDFFAPRTKKEHCYLLGYETTVEKLFIGLMVVIMLINIYNIYKFI